MQLKDHPDCICCLFVVDNDMAVDQGTVFCTVKRLYPPEFVDYDTAVFAQLNVQSF